MIDNNTTQEEKPLPNPPAPTAVMSGSKSWVPFAVLGLVLVTALAYKFFHV